MKQAFFYLLAVLTLSNGADLIEFPDPFATTDLAYYNTVNSSELLAPPDPFASSDTGFCKPPAKDVLNLYGGLTSSIVLNDDRLRAGNQDLDWNNIIAPVPSSLAVLGGLMLITSDWDVGLVSPRNGWQHVKWPSSLRASLLQVAHECHGALSDAHNNMDRIRIRTMNVPNFFKEVVSLLVKGSPQEKRAMLPVSLQGIQDVAERCTELADQSAKQFNSVTALIQELQQGCLATKGNATEELHDTVTDIQVTKKEEEKLKEVVTEQKNRVEKTEKTTDELLKSFQDQIKKAPSGFKLFMGSMGDLLVKGANMFVDDFAGGMGGMFGGINGMKGGGGGGGGGGSAGIIGGLYGAVKGALAGFKNDVVGKLQDKMHDVVGLVSQLTNPKNYPFSSQIQQAGALHAFLDNLKFPISNSEDVKDEIKSKAAGLVDKGMKMLKEIEDRGRKLIDPKTSKFDDIDQQATGWATEITAFKQQFDNMLGTHMGPPSPEMAKHAQSSGGGGIAATMENNWRQSVSSLKEQMNVYNKMLQEQQKRLDENMEHEAHMVAKLLKLQITEKRLDETIKILQQAVRQLGLLYSHWTKIASFFESIKSVLKDDWVVKLFHFTDQVNALIKANGFDNDFDLSSDTLYKSAFRAVSFNYRIFRMATTYTRISTKHFLPPLEKMSLLLDISPSKEKDKFDKAKQDLEDSLKGAQEDIRDLVLQDRATLKGALTVYRDNMDKQFKKLCPNDDSHLEKKLQKIADDGVKKGNDYGFDFSGGF